MSQYERQEHGREAERGGVGRGAVAVEEGRDPGGGLLGVAVVADEEREQRGRPAQLVVVDVVEQRQHHASSTTRCRGSCQNRRRRGREALLRVGARHVERRRDDGRGPLGHLVGVPEPERERHAEAGLDAVRPDQTAASAYQAATARRAGSRRAA